MNAEEMTFEEFWENRFGWFYMNVTKKEARKLWNEITEDIKSSENTTTGNK